MKDRLSRIAALAGGYLTGVDRTVGEVAVDSRTSLCGSETLFVALRGPRHDGHDYLRALYGRGVRAFLVAVPPAEAWPEAGFVVVADPLTALQALAADRRSRFPGTVVGITGSNGKTTVKEWASECAPPGWRLFRSPRSYNSQVGVALALLMIEGTERVALIEAGISEPGEMERLARMIRPEIGVLTNLGEAHAEHFASNEAKLLEKLRLFDDCPCVLCRSDDTSIWRSVDAAKRIDSARFDDARFPDLPSRHNAATVVALWATLGVDPAETSRRLACIRPLAMRLEVREGVGRTILVNDTYTADVTALGIALDRLGQVAAGRPKALILSDLQEHGEDEETLYRRVARLVERTGIDRMVGIGAALARHAALFPARLTTYPTTEAYLARLPDPSLDGHAILVKGSRTAALDRVVGALERRVHRTVLEVDLDAMRSNLNRYRARLQRGVQLVAMVKASAYGAGTGEVASMLQHEGVDFLAVAFADEGTALRERGISMPVIVLNADSASYPVLLAQRLEPEIYGFSSLAAFAAEARRHGERHYPIHLKLDTGMHRLGFVEEELDELLRRLEIDGEWVRVASVFSHLATADDPAADGATRGQLARFERMSSRLLAALPYPVLRHVANSAAIERFPEAQYDMVRLGIGLYGIAATGCMGLSPTATLRARIVQIRDLAAGEAVGYGGAERLTRPTRSGTVAIGYADGLDRRLGCGAWAMRVHGQPAPTLGRICMDCCMIDLTDIPQAQEGDPALVFSPLAGNRVEEMARLLGTIPYEVMTGVSARVERLYIKE